MERRSSSVKHNTGTRPTVKSHFPLSLSTNRATARKSRLRCRFSPLSTHDHPPCSRGKGESFETAVGRYPGNEEPGRLSRPESNALAEFRPELLTDSMRLEVQVERVRTGKRPVLVRNSSLRRRTLHPTSPLVRRLPLGRSSTLNAPCPCGRNSKRLAYRITSILR